MEIEDQQKEYPLVKKSYSRPYEDAAYFYVQSRSRRAWATYVSDTREGNGYLYDDSSVRVKTYYTAEMLEKIDSISERPHLGVPTRLTIVDDIKDLNKARNGYNSSFERLGSVYFRNPFKEDDLLIAVGYFEEEAITHLVRNGCEGVRVEMFVDKPSTSNEIVYLVEIVR
jgi:hypothetical protein